MKNVAVGVLTGLSIMLGSVSLRAAPLDLKFAPPQIAAQGICVAKRADAQIEEQWKHWDRTSLPKLEPKLIVRDAQRLRDLDASKNFDVVARIFELLPTVDPKRSAEDLAVERVKLLIAAGRIKELKELGLVEKLLSAESTLVPRALGTLADLYMQGLVVAKDEKKGLALLVNAANGGDAESLLALAKLNLAGRVVDGWTVDPQLAVVMAFGALVGKLDPAICDRIARIAREYSNGEVVAQDQTLSEAWYRLAADLGDAGAAWKVAGLNIDSEDITKDNATLLKYLGQAADGGVVPAIVELGRVYEAGSLTQGDLRKAADLYRQAGNAGSRGGLVRLILMMERLGQDRTDRAGFTQVLQQLASLSNPPGWVYAKLARSLLEERGRWAVEAEARTILEKGVALGDPDAQEMLAAILLRDRTIPGNFEHAIELMSRVVETIGKIDPMTDLHDAYLCRDPKASNLRLAAFWNDNDERAGSSTLALDPAKIRALDPKKDLITIATLQTQALYLRPKPLAYYLYYLEQHGAPAKELAFWRSRATATLQIRAAVARFAYDTSRDDVKAINRLLGSMAEIADDGEVSLGVDIAHIVLENFPEDEKRIDFAKLYLRKAAAAGIGKALQLLSRLEKGSGLSEQQIYAEYEDVIEARGDTDGLLFAAGVVNEAAKKDLFLARVVSIMPCDFDNVASVTDAYAALNNQAEVSHWLDIGEILADNNGWRLAAIANRRLALQGASATDKAIALYTVSMNLGEPSAVTRLLKIYSDADKPTYSPTNAANLFETMLAKAEAKEIAGLIERVRKSAPAIRNIVLPKIDVAELYTTRANNGDPVAMRELALLLRNQENTPENAAVVTSWFRKAADLGDTPAMVELAKAYSLGIGIEPSLGEATKWLTAASRQGNGDAKRLVNTMTVSSATQ